MRRRNILKALVRATVGCVALVVFSQAASACTNILVSRGASEDGSVIVSFNVDGAGAGILHRTPAGLPSSGAEDAAGADWDRPTYQVLGFMNDQQLSFGETTTVGHRPEFDTPGEGVPYHRLLFLTLQRCKTAREGINEINRLVQKYGYGSTPEVFSIGDKNEVWIMEIVSKGPDERGAVWVAARVPDGYITAHANMNRIRTFPLDDPENWLYSADVVTYATEKGYYDPTQGKPFSFQDAYHATITKYQRRACAGRVWSIYRRAAPSQDFPVGYFRGEDGAEDYPLFIKPDKKLSVQDVMTLMRDHFEGTPYDMTKGVDAGPFGSPYRYRDLTWTVGDKTYGWERPVSSQQAACCWIAQSRNWLPDMIGGIFWYAPDDAYTSCFAPFYCGISEVSQPYQTGDFGKFTWDSAWWVHNIVSNYAYDRWSRVIPDIQKAQAEVESKTFKMLPIIEKTAMELGKNDPKLVREYLTNYCMTNGDATFRRWEQLATDVFTKHNDGWVKEPGDAPKGVGYPQEWLEHVVKDRADELLIDEPLPEH
ncbi:MAG: C69 family dipeptidase [Pirellulales bacterium]